MMSGSKEDPVEKSSTLPLDNVAGALAQAVTWAQASIPVGLLPQWVFVANIALAEQRGYTVERGSARPGVVCRSL